MAARPISELANWDGHLDQKRQNSKWGRSSSSHARDPYQTALNLETSQPSSIKLSEKKRAEKSFFHSNLGHASMANTPTNARLASRVDTTSNPFHDMHDDHHRSISLTPPRPVLPSSPSTTLSILSLSSPILSVPPRVHNSRIPPSLAPSQPASTLESEVIDLTLEDTEEELSVGKKSVPNTAHLNNRSANPAPRRRPLSSAPSSPILPEQSLFTPPPPPRRRTRLFVDYLQVPPLPNGLTKADYQPISRHHDMSLPGSTIASMPHPASFSESQATGKHTHSPQRRKSKEPSLDIISSNRKHKPCVPVIGADVTPSKLLDLFYEPREVPLYDDDTYPPLTTWDLATNTRFQFAHAWRAHASQLREAELDWTSNHRILGKASIWARSSDSSSPRIPGTTGYVSIEHLRPWELALPKESTEHASDGQAHGSETRAVADLNSNNMLLVDDNPRAPNVVADSALSNSAVSQPFSSVVVDTENDMKQYFNGLGDSPNKHIPSRQQLAPTHAFRSHLLHSAGRADMNSFDFGFPSLDLDPPLADTIGQECFLGVPPSPTTADMNPLIASVPTSASPFEPASYITASPSNAFAADGPLADVWTFEQGECPPLDDKSYPGNDVPPTVPGTINPSLLGPEQPETPSVEPQHTQKRRSKLPEPVIYIRRPVDSSALPMIAGKRPVQIKYRDPGVSSASPSTRKLSNESSSNHAENPTELFASETDEPLPTKRRPVPSRKLVEAYTASESESDSDFIPDTSKSKIKLKIKRPSLGDKEAIAQYQDTEDDAVPTMSFCHQCRNKSMRPKMSCSNTVDDRVCGKRFCNRCILYRYPDITFDEHSAGFLCPVCTNTCNCSHCSRNRGEEFISMRLGGLAASIFKSKMTLVRDAGRPLHHAKSPGEGTQRDTTATQAGEPEHPQFWAHVYGIEGQRVGSAFMTRDHTGRLHAPSASASVSAPPLLALSEEPSQSQPRQKVQKPRRREKKRERPIGPRVFIGRPLASWKIRAVRDLEPSADVNMDENADEMMTGKGKGRARGCRWYIGNPTALFEPYGRMPGSGMASPMSVSSRCSTPGMCSDRSLTPLSEVAADDWPQPEVGECCEWAPRGVGVGMGTVVAHGASDFSGPSGLFSGQGLGGGVGLEATMDMVHADEGSTSTTLSEQDMERAISAALAAISVEPPCQR